MVFGSLATLKTISDHCGYVFPWDPFLYINRNGASFHDLHHQTWGLKVSQLLFAPDALSIFDKLTLDPVQHNFSTYTAFWDIILGTEWDDLPSAAQRYSRNSKARVNRDQDFVIEPANLLAL